MRHLIYLMIFFFHISAFAQDFVVPDNIDCGKFNIRINNYEDADDKYILTARQYSKSKIINISNDVIYLYDSKVIYSYDNDIVDNGNYIIPGVGPNCSYPGDTLGITIKCKAKYLDEISQAGKYLRGTYRIFYRKRNSLKLDSIDIGFKFKVVDKEELFIMGEKNINSSAYPYYFEQKRHRSGFLFLFNAQEKNFVIDSINYSTVGNNIDSLEFNVKDSTINSFPYKVKVNKFFGIDVNYRFIDRENSACNFSIFGHYEGETDQVIYQDTINLDVSVTDDLYMSRYDAPFEDSLYTFMGDTISFRDIRIYNFTDESWDLNKVNYEILAGENSLLFQPAFPIPKTIEKNENIKLEEFKYINLSKGYKKILINLEFTNGDRDKINHNVVYSFYIDFFTDVKEPINASNNISIIPNPATDKVYIKFPNETLLGNSIKVFNNNGKLLSSSKVDNNNYLINTEKFPNGVYHIFIKNKDKFFSKSFLVIH